MKLSGYLPWGPPKVIHCVKDDTVLQVFCQEPSTSSKYPHQGHGVLDTLLIMLKCWNFAHRLGIECPEQLWGQRCSMSSISLVRNPQCHPSHWWWWGESWHTSNHVRRLKLGTQAGNPMPRTIMRTRRTHVLHVTGQVPSMSSKSLMMMGGILKHF